MTRALALTLSGRRVRRPAPVLAAALMITLAGCQEDAGLPTGPELAPSLALTSNTWTGKAPYPGPALGGMSAAPFPNSAGQSLVYLIGGVFRNGEEREQTGFNIKIYNAATNTWEVTPGTPVDVYNTNGVGAIGTKLYFSGGYSGEEASLFPIFSNRLWAYDVVTKQLVRKADMPKLTAEGVSGAINGKLYVLAGQCDANQWPRPGYCHTPDVTNLFRYNPATNTWTSLRSAPRVHRSGAAGVIRGKLYVVGGVRKDGNRPVAELDVYDPATNTWKTLAPMPTAGKAIGAAMDGKLFVISGPNAYVYNPLTNKWRTIAAPAQAHDAVVRVLIDGKAHLLAVGGAQGPAPGVPNDSELYTP